MLTKHAVVLYLDGRDGTNGRRYFFQGIPREGHQPVGTALAVDEVAWQDMGRPDKVTVTVEPGDMLND